MLDIKRIIASAPKKPERVELRPLLTPWGERLIGDGEEVRGAALALGEGEEVRGAALPHGDGEAVRDAAPCLNNGEAVQSAALHPHPQFERERFMLLDGWWEYCFVAAENAASEWQSAELPLEFEGRIRVPFSPEALLSGVGRQLKPDELLWYRRAFVLPDALAVAPDERCMLHFEAVDYCCACYCNGVLLGTHVGTYLGFAFDITEALVAGENEIALCVYDPSDEGVQLRGKQKLTRGGIWYTAQSGIWQTVWLEVVPEHHIATLTIDAQADTGQLTLSATVHGSPHSVGAASDSPENLPLPLGARVFDGDQEVGSRAANTSSLTLNIAEPRLWSPDDPHLYRLELTYGEDRVASYCAFRTITMEDDEHGVKRLHLNHKPCFLRGVLDQGYWPDGLLTAPSDEALIFDIRAMKDLGFNLLRKHIKVESERWYYHCDRLGMLVWQDMVSGGSPLSAWHSSYKPTFFRWSWGHYNDATPRHYEKLSAGDSAFRAEWSETCADTVSRLKNHPSIITWVLFNEGWGQFEARRATEMVRALDPTRPIDAVSGWYDQRCGDFLSVHNYFRPLEVYKDSAALPGRAFVISEFGGLSYPVAEHCSLSTSYGYESFSDLASFRAAVRDVLAQADKLEQRGLAGFVYTQLSDVEEETNGILTYDRRVNKLSEADNT